MLKIVTSRPEKAPSIVLSCPTTISWTINRPGPETLHGEEVEV